MLNTIITIGDNDYTVEMGKCYSIFELELNEVTHDEYKEFTRNNNSTRQADGDEISNNIVYWYDDNSGMFFVKSRSEYVS